jgi:hypothetical protein
VGFEPCEPRYFDHDPGTPYYCGSLLAEHDVENKAERCPGGTFICVNCFESFEEFMDRVENKKACEAEWEF